MPLWQFNNLGIILCHHSFLLHCPSLTSWKLLPFSKRIWFFFLYFKNAATPTLAPTMLDGPSGLNVDLICIQQSGSAFFCKSYAKLYFDAKHFEKGLNKGWWNFCFPFFKKKKVCFSQYWKLSKYSILDPTHHNIELYDLLIACPFDP